MSSIIIDEQSESSIIRTNDVNSYIVVVNGKVVHFVAPMFYYATFKWKGIGSTTNYYKFWLGAPDRKDPDDFYQPMIAPIDIAYRLGMRIDNSDPIRWVTGIWKKGDRIYRQSYNDTQSRWDKFYAWGQFAFNTDITKSVSGWDDQSEGVVRPQIHWRITESEYDGSKTEAVKYHDFMANLGTEVRLYPDNSLGWDKWPAE